MGHPSQSAGDRMREGDGELLDALRAGIRGTDPLPAYVKAGARAAFSLRDVPVLPAPDPRPAAAAQRRRGR